MKEIRLSLDQFDLDSFIVKILDFLKVPGPDDIDPSSAISWVESPGKCPNDGDRNGWDFRSKLLNNEVFLFFPFAFPNYDGSFECADGNSYAVTTEDEDCFIGEDVIGYLMRVSNGTISIASAISPLSGCIPPPTVKLFADGRELKQPMVNFIHEFTK